ncbi:DUF732 domain-containing protein [Mycobacterium sp. MS1601]|uniref:DUF732 domain-containing protein n=1 Tax=Mycobacterium sp. MS1601 TaxID=1936029 RepID=UPI001F27B145|nr:DUF732 domain-containing protein [Mycobacterium sp. MS1601]
MNARIFASGVIVAAVSLGTAAPAFADSDSENFVNMLARYGEDVSGPEVALASVDVGYAICNLLETYNSGPQMLSYMINNGRSPENANLWLAASVINLCPELNYLTGY